MPQVHESVLVTRVLDLLENRPKNLTLERVSRETDIPIPWLKQLPKADPNGSVHIIRIEKLYSYLSGVDLSRAIR